MKKLIVIFGPPAVGKMTVGYELSKLTGLKLLHNHMTIDLVLQFFDWGEQQSKLSSEFRKRIFEEVASSDLQGLIFTFVWALDDPRDKEYIDSMCDIFERKGGVTYFVELYATQSERLLRNESEFRLSKKVPKRDTEKSRKHLIDVDQKHMVNTSDTFFYEDRYIKIDNTNKSPAEVAELIVTEFGFRL